MPPEKLLSRWADEPDYTGAPTAERFPTFHRCLRCQRPMYSWVADWPLLCSDCPPDYKPPTMPHRIGIGSTGP
jgi:hypothetical protein